jgi:HAD superfamily hydrolase (TIGR01490 family)
MRAFALSGEYLYNSGIFMHIFDLDHTITRRSTGRHYVSIAIGMKVVPVRVLLSLINVSLRYRWGRLSSSHINRDLRSVMGIKRSVLEEIAIKAFEEKARDDVYPKALEYIQVLKDRGEDIAIATSSVDFIVKPLTEYLGIEKVIASSMEFVDGLCTGKFVDMPTFSQQKRVKVLSFLEENGTSADSCSFYSDSIYDLPLMEAVGNPVPTNPDFLLARYAKRVGWETLDFS